MRKLVAVLGCSMLMLATWAPAQAVSASSSKSSRTTMHIVWKTSNIFQFDASPNGDGPTTPATTVNAVVKNCPAGTYSLDGTFKQNGADVPIARDGLGGAEYTCTGSKSTPVSLSFTSPDLRPGYARTHLSLRPLGCESSSCSIVGKRVVRVPGKITSVNIKYKTSEIYPYDASPNGDGPEEPTVNVDAVVKNCPAGDYRLSGSLTQDGADVPLVRDSLGGGEYTCTGSKLTSVSLAFSSVALHPGKARARFALYPLACERKACSYRATRIVRIPASAPTSPSS